MKFEIGFTLVELLVVMAILTILTGLLLPALKNSKETIRSAVCVANLRQMGVAHTNYINDNDGALIPGAISTVPYWTTWYRILSPYLGETAGAYWNRNDLGLKWRVCPSQPIWAGEPNDAYVIRYAWNYGYLGYTSAVPGWGWNSFIQDVTHPENTVAIADCNDDYTFDLANRYTQLYFYTGYTSTTPNRIPRRHKGGGNYLFLDGHVSWYSVSWIIDNINRPACIFWKNKNSADGH